MQTRIACNHYQTRTKHPLLTSAYHLSVIIMLMMMMMGMMLTVLFVVMMMPIVIFYNTAYLSSGMQIELN